MAEVFEGVLSLKGEGKDRRRFLSYTSKKGKPMNELVNPDKLASSLRESQEAEIQVSFELDPSGRPFRIRALGKPWTESAIPVRTRTEESVMKPEFHNPYNFVPAPPRTKNGKPIRGELGDREPSGHDRYLADKLSGKLHVRMTVETPLLVPDTARVEVNEADTQNAKQDHKTFPVRVDGNGRPLINPTSIKGMLRSAYEAITVSRLSVFQKHEERLAFRSEATSSQGLEAVRIHNGNEIHFYSAAWLGMYKSLRTNWNGLDTHGKEVWVKVTPRRHQRRNFQFFEVVDLKDIGEPRPSQDHHIGFVCITNENIKNKHDERVFFKGPSARPPLILNDLQMTELKDAWKTLIENYHEAHKDELDKPPASLGVRKWSRQIYKRNNEEILKEGTLCYARMRGGVVEELLPVMISRRLYQVCPAELLPEQLHPAETLAELSSADRLFGWVRQPASKARQIKHTKEDLKQGAYRGQVRIGFVGCELEDAVELLDPLPLQILGQPKPQQGRFYVAETQDGEAQLEKRNNEEAGFKRGRGLRGRKVYPHHNVPKGYWEGKWASPSLNENGISYFQEYRRPEGENQCDNQNRSTRGWIRKGAAFEFEIHFINLSNVELGALIWLLDLPENHFHRFGGGKPLGFGSVRLNLEEAKSEILNGTDVKHRYESLDLQTSRSVTAAQCKTEFEKAIVDAYPNRLFLESFKRAAQGFEGKPIHYPRARHTNSMEPVPPHRDGLAYEWFVENAKPLNKDPKKRANPETQFVLPDLVDDEGLPVLFHRP